MSTRSDIRLIAHQSVGMPRNDVPGACGDRHRASGAHIVFDRRGGWHRLNFPDPAALRLCAVPTFEDASEVDIVIAVGADRRACTAGRARAVAAGGQYQPLI